MTKQIAQKHNLWKKIVLVFAVCLVAIFVAGASFVLIVTADARLDMSKLSLSPSPLVIEASDGTRIDSSLVASASIEEIPQHTKDAFIAIEDKRFLKHHGIDFRRVGGAAIHNIKNHDKSQGASTITQQLVKNTHLSPEKTLTRKLKEMKIATQVENKMTKDEILESYLNHIYFGNGCTGIEAAANYYFGKKTKELSVAESAMLAGIIRSPSASEPKNHFDKANSRKNLVLQQMKDQNLISEEEFLEAKSCKLNFVFKKPDNSFDEYNACAKAEAAKILKIDADALEKNEYVIETYANINTQQSLAEQIKKVDIPQKNEAKGSFGAVVVDPNCGGVKAFATKGSFDFAHEKRQPASTLKPLLVYGAAMEEQVITPESFVLDKKTNFGGYEPKNAGDTYLGWISARVAIAKSKNVPAVKILDMVGIEKAKDYCKNAKIEFDEEDNNLTLALGGMNKGVTIFDIAQMYTTFLDGNFKSAKFVRSIKTKDGVLLYEADSNVSPILSDSTAYLVTDMLRDAAKTGTAKKFADVGFDVASKTGTIGFGDVNTDCYNVAYTTNDIIVSLLTKGNENISFDSSVNGASTPTDFNKEVLLSLYAKETPSNFVQPQSVVELDLDSRALEKFELRLAAQDAPPRYKIKALFDANNHPTQVYEEQTIVPQQNKSNNFVSLIQQPATMSDEKKDSLKSVLDNIFSTFS